MVSIGNFFFKYRNLLFPVFALSIFIPSRPVFSMEAFGENYYLMPFTIGLLVALSGQVIRAATIGLKYIIRGGRDKKVHAETLVVEGMFHHCRNPLYVGNILMLVGVGIMSNSMLFIFVSLPIFIFIYQAIVVAEENFLRNKFGQQYEEYCNRVNRWLPDLRGIRQTFASMEFKWNRYIIKEYNTVYLLLLSMYIIALTHHPALIRLTMREKTILSAIIFVSLSIIYLVVRHLKKTKRLVVR